MEGEEQKGLAEETMTMREKNLFDKLHSLITFHVAFFLSNSYLFLPTGNPRLKPSQSHQLFEQICDACKRKKNPIRLMCDNECALSHLPLNENTDMSDFSAITQRKFFFKTFS